MKKTYWADFCLLLLLLFPLLVSCAKYETVSSQKDFDSEFDKSINLQEKESFYYYYGEKIPVEQHADMLFIQFSSKEHKESYKRKLTSVSSLQLYSSNANNFQQDDESSFLVAYSTIGNLSSKQLSEIEYEDGDKVSHLFVVTQEILLLSQSQIQLCLTEVGASCILDYMIHKTN